MEDIIPEMRNGTDEFPIVEYPECLVSKRNAFESRNGFFFPSFIRLFD